MSMRILTLRRGQGGDQGTPGTLRGAGLRLCTLEPPDRGNRPNLSCIPPGVYQCVPHSSAKYPEAFRLLEVPGREGILVHAGNWAGDAAQGLRSDSSGCILVGADAGELAGQLAVTGSRAAMRRLRAWAGGKGFKLVIEAFSGHAGPNMTGIPAAGGENRRTANVDQGA